MHTQIIMSDYIPPIQPPQPIEGWIRIEPIKDDEEKDRYPAQEKISPQDPRSLAIFLFILKNTFSILLKKTTPSEFNKKAMGSNLLSFQKHLMTLMNEDQSHDPSFTMHFSSLWHKLTEDFNILNQHKAANDPTLNNFITLLEGIENYPPWEEHSLGFYLSHHGGENWYPIPFMEILFTLHLEAKNNPSLNILQHWSKLITDIKESL